MIHGGDLRTMRWRGAGKPLAAALALVAACGPLREVVEGDRATPHERYAESLRQAGLDERTLGREWLAASERALHDPLPVSIPFRETGFFDGAAPSARGYRIAGRRGQRLVVTVQAAGDRLPRGTDAAGLPDAAAGGPGPDTAGALAAGLFVDLFRVEPDEDEGWDHLETGDSIALALRHELDSDGLYVVRLQPELLRPVRYTLTIEVEPTLAFPVQEHGPGDIRSGFGAERDAGRRVHHGVDIFAPRGTPVLAAAEGRVRVGTNRLGGRVVWQRVPGLGALYYAHLDSQAPVDGRVLRPGDTLGFVGNTGNAVTTPPHLHFGIYARPGGPVDPFPFLAAPAGEPPEPLGPEVPLGRLVRVTDRVAYLRGSPSLEGQVLDTVVRGTVAVLTGGAGSWRRIELADGTAGFARAVDLAPADEPLRREPLARPVALRSRPDSSALVLTELPAGAEVAVLGGLGDWTLVAARAAVPVRGWLAPDALIFPRP